jgi:hypothetical protein
MKTYKIVVPAGIGDVSWIWSKLATIEDAKFEIFVPDAYPQRTQAYCNLLMNCKGLLGKHIYRDILTWGANKNRPTWEGTVANHDEGDFIYLQCNEWLGEGRKLNDWLPDLKTDFHYKFNFDVNDGTIMGQPIQPGNCFEGPTMAISMASMRGIRAWNAWLPETWAEFIKYVSKEYPDITFIFLGGDWDIDTVLETLGNLPNNIKYLDLVGMTSIADAIKILQRADYFIGFSSGLSVIRNVLNKPGCTMWPKHQAELMYSWPDPATVDSRDYLGFIWDNPERIFKRLIPKMRTIYGD